MTSEASYSTKMIMGGRYLKETYDGEFMGEPFHGGGLMGFNNGSGMFEHCWIDSMSTGMMHAQGKRDGSVVELQGQFSGPNGQVVHTRDRLTLVGPDEFKLEASNDAMGEEAKVMEIVFTRKQKGSDCR